MQDDEDFHHQVPSCLPPAALRLPSEIAVMRQQSLKVLSPKRQQSPKVQSPRRQQSLKVQSSKRFSSPAFKRQSFRHEPIQESFRAELRQQAMQHQADQSFLRAEPRAAPLGAAVPQQQPHPVVQSPSLMRSTSAPKLKRGGALRGSALRGSALRGSMRSALNRAAKAVGMAVRTAQDAVRRSRGGMRCG